MFQSFSKVIVAGASLALPSVPVPAAATPHSAQSARNAQPPRNVESGPAPIVSYTADKRPVAFDLFRGSRIFLTGAINGAPSMMMLDSGASMTVLDAAFARKIGVKGDRQMPIRGAGGSSPGEIASNVTVAVGPLQLAGSDVIIMDLTPIAQAIGRPIPVILGHDALAAGPVTIDFPKRAMTFLRPEQFRAPVGAVRVPLGHDGPFRSVKVSVAGLPPVDATFDIGNAGALFLAKSFWESAPAISGLRSAQTQLGGVGGMKLARKVTLPKVEFGGETFEAVPAFLNDDRAALPTEGANLGIEMLKPFAVTLDYAQDAIYLRRSRGWEGFSRERAGLGSHFLGDRLKLTYVSPDGPAMAAGLKAGDEIVTIDGKAVDGGYFSTETSLWAQRAAGTTVRLGRADGTTVELTLRDYY